MDNVAELENSNAPFAQFEGYLFAKLQPRCPHHDIQRLWEVEDRHQLPHSREDGYVSVATMLVLQDSCDSGNLRNLVLHHIRRWYTDNWDPPTEQFGKVIIGLLSVFHGHAFRFLKARGKLKSVSMSTSPPNSHLLFDLEGDAVKVSLERFSLSTHHIWVDPVVHPPIAGFLGLELDDAVREFERYTSKLRSPGVDDAHGAYPPLTPSMRDDVDPTYADFYTTCLEGTPLRPRPGRDPMVDAETGLVHTSTEIKALRHCKMKIYFPEDRTDPHRRYPTALWFHGGKTTSSVRRERGFTG